MTPLDFYGQTYRYQTAGDPEREIGVIRGLGGTWIVGYKGTAGHHRIKSPRLPAGPDPAALQTALDEWAAERALPTGSVGPVPQGSTPAPLRPAAGTTTAGDGGADAAGSAGAPSVPAVVHSTGESEGPRSLGGARGSAPLNAADALPATGLFDRDPANDQEATQWIRDRISLGRRAAVEIAVLIAHVRAYYYRDDASGWLTWANREFGYQRRFVFQCLRAGALIQRVRHAALTSCDVEKLDELARIPADQLPTLLDHWDPSQATRDEVRRKVAMWDSRTAECEQCGAEFEPQGDETVCPACAGARPARQKPRHETAADRAIDLLAGLSDAEAREIAGRTGAGTGFRAAFRMLDVALFHVAEYHDLDPEMFAHWDKVMCEARRVFDDLKAKS